MSAATLPGVDAAVDLSGPVEWAGMDVVRRGRALDVPVLVAMATSEGPEEAAGAQEIVANAPAGSALLTPDTGHGYVLLNDSDGAVLPLGGGRAALDQPARVGRLTYSQFLTTSLRSAVTLSTPAPQSIMSRSPSRARIVSLPP